jgi:hypothetical protein
MPSPLSLRLKQFERRLRTSFGDDLSTPKGRRQAWWHFQLFDHAFLRVWWTNFDKVAEGVYRSNHPGPKRLERYRRMGVKAILNLRGVDGYSPWLFEKEACDRLGLELHVAKIYARRPAGREELLHLIGKMRTIPKPFVLHCKSGADRAGLAAVLYKLAIEGASIEEAQKHLSWRYVHLKSTQTGVVDYIVERWAKRHGETGIGIEEWIATEYDPGEVWEGFNNGRAL